MHILRGCAALLVTGSVAAVAHAQQSVAAAHAQQPPAAAQMLVVAENPLDLMRTDETIVIAWSAVTTHIAGATAARVRVLDSSGNELTSQVVDSGGDGVPDELVFQASFWPRERREFRIEPLAPVTRPVARAFARHDEERDDVAWETDRIGFRMYGQGLWTASAYQPLVSSGIDVWPKRVRDLIVERWYAKGHDAYHLDTGEGADFYTVGPTLGAGGSAVWRNGELHRARNFRSHRILASGPVRLIFELEYEAWDAGGVQVSETKRITMDAGQHIFRQDITYRIDGLPAVEYAVGTVKRDGLVGSTSRARAWAWQSTWGPVERKNGGHGSLGTAVLMERSRLVGAVESADHYFLVGAAQHGQRVTQYVGAGWTASGDFAGVESWWSHLDSFARRLEQPLRVTTGRTP